MILETQRIRLREFEEDDVDALYSLDSDPDVMRYISDGRTCTRADIESAIPRVRNYYQQNPGYGIWLAELKDDGQFLGWACLKHLDQTEDIEVGYRLMKAFWNQGYATEAARALIDYGFEQLKLDRIVAITHPDNAASQRVLEKCGLRREGNRLAYGSECYFFALRRMG